MSRKGTETTPSIEAIREGFRTSHQYTISQGVYDHFLAASQDRNPLHTEDEFARQHGFAEKVMHGMILNSFISHFVGMVFPGGPVLLQSTSTQFKSPCHLGDEIRIDMTVSQVVESVRVFTMDMVLTNLTRARVAAKAKVQVGLL